MRISTIVALLLPLTSYPIAYFAQRRLHPRTATWVMSVAAVALATAGTFTLGVVAIHAAIRVPQVQSLTGLSEDAIVANEHTTIAASLLASAALGLVLTLTVGFLARHVGTLIRSFEYARNLPGDTALVVTSDETAEAYSVPGSPSRIVISTGMLAALDEDQQRALLAHEQSHLRHRHFVFASLVRFAAIASPMVRPLSKAVAFTLERWADEDAARSVEDRKVVASAVTKAAIARKRRSRVTPGVLVFNIVGSFPRRAQRMGPVPRRVSALLAPEPTSSWVIIAITAVLVACSAAYAVGAWAHLHDLIRIARSTQ